MFSGHSICGFNRDKISTFLGSESFQFKDPVLVTIDPSSIFSPPSLRLPSRINSGEFYLKTRPQCPLESNGSGTE